MRSFFRSTRALLLVMAGVAGVSGFQASPAGAETTATFSIGGKAVTPEGAGISGVTVKIDGTTKTASTSDTGDYLFPSLPAGSYTLLASKPGLVFDPLSRVVTLPATDGEFAPNGRARFVGKPLPMYVAGLIKDGSGVAVGGAHVTLVPAVTPSTLPTLAVESGVDGRYRFDNVPKGAYKVVPTKDHFSFAPVSADLTLPTTGLEYSPNGRANFTATKLQDDLKVYGRIVTADAVGVPNIKIYNTTAITDTTVPVAITGPDGRWAVEHLKAGKYYFIPKSTAFTFNPVYGAVELPTTGVDGSPNGKIIFTATPVAPTKFAIRGKVINAKGYPMLGVTITIGNGLKTTTTDANGEYRVGDLPAGDYTVTPSKPNFTFTPASKTVTLPTSGEATSPAGICNFQGQENVAVKYVIGGKVVGGTGAALPGVTLTLGSTGLTTTTSTTGEYKFEGLAAGSYVVTPSKTNFTFQPVNATVAVPTTGQTFSPNGMADFKGTEATNVKYTIYGQIKVSTTAAALAGVTVKLNDGTTVVTTSNSEGNFAVTNLPAGKYTLHLALDGYTFDPSTPTVTFPLTSGAAYYKFDIVAVAATK